MNYIQTSLMPGEKIHATGDIHWIIYFPGVLISTFSLLSTPITSNYGWIGFSAGVFSLIQSWIFASSTELAITNKRFIAKFGLLHRTTVEILLHKVEDLKIEQNYLGYLLNFGTIVINDSGIIKTSIHRVTNPILFKTKVTSILHGHLQQLQ